MRPLPSPRFCAALMLAVAYALPAQAQDWLRQAIPLESRTHDFGSVARAANTEHRFEIKNTLTSDMHLSSVRASCGCTTPIIETKVIKPGETGTILARFNTGTFTGQKSATLTVSVTQPFRTEIQLSVKGYIRSDIVVSPGEANFGEVNYNEPKELKLSLSYAGRSDWEILKIDSPLDYVDVDFTETLRSGGKVQYEITAQLSENAPLGMLHNQLILQTNDKRITSVPLRLLANVQSAIRMSPAALALGDVQQGLEIQQRLVIKGPEPFKVLGVSSEIAEVSFDASDESKSAHLLNLVIKPNQAGKFDGLLIVKTDMENQPTQLKLSYDSLPGQIVDAKPRIAVPVSK